MRSAASLQSGLEKCFSAHERNSMNLPDTMQADKGGRTYDLVGLCIYVYETSFPSSQDSALCLDPSAWPDIPVIRDCLVAHLRAWLCVIQFVPVPNTCSSICLLMLSRAAAVYASYGEDRMPFSTVSSSRRIRPSIAPARSPPSPHTRPTLIHRPLRNLSLRLHPLHNLLSPGLHHHATHNHLP